MRLGPSPGTIMVVSAEQLVGLEAAVADLGSLYTVARTFAALQSRAESELLPRVTALGARLRSLVRHGELTQADVDAASAEVLSVRAEWRSALDAVRASSTYQRALSAFAADRQEELATLIPQIFAGVRRVHADTVYFPVPAATGRRRPGHSPFLGAAECADRMVALLASGPVAEAGGTEWWDQELPFITCAEAPDAFETPLSMCLRAAPLPVFAARHEATLRIYTPRLRAPLVAVLTAEAADEWWDAYEGSYTAFRDALRNELVARGVAVSVSGEGGSSEAM